MRRGEGFAIMVCRTVRRLAPAVLALLAALAASAFGAALEGTESLLLDDFKGISRWSQSNWAEADTDPSGRVRYVPRIEQGIGPEGEPALSVTLHFKPGGYSQGVVLQAAPGDWSTWDELVVDLKLVQDIPGLSPRAKAIIFPDDQWTESADAYSTALKAGEWVTLRVPLGESMPADLWSTPTDTARLGRVRAWAVKFFALNVPETSEPVQIIIARPRLVRAGAGTEEGAGGSGDGAAPRRAPAGEAGGAGSAGEGAGGEAGVTVSRLFRIVPGAQGAERIEVAGLEPAASRSYGRIALTLALKPGLFGPAASLRLESRPGNVFPERLAPVKAEDALGPYYFVEVWSANALSTRAAYEATLSYSGDTGVLSAAFGPRDGERFVEGHLRLARFEALGALSARPGPSHAIESLAFEVHRGAAVLGAPFGLPQGVKMRVAAAGDERPFTWVARSEVRTAHAGEPLRVAFQGLPDLPLDLELVAVAGGERRRLWAGRPPAGGEVILPGGTLAPGRHVIRLSAVDRSEAYDLAEAEVELVQAFLSASARAVGFLPGERRLVVEVALSADRPVPELPITLRVGGRESALWTGVLALTPGEAATIPLEIPADEADAFTLAIADIPFVEHPAEVPIAWTEEGLAAYLNAALASEPGAASPGPLTRFGLAAAVARWLGLSIADEAHIAGGAVSVSARRSPLRDGEARPQDAAGDVVQDLLQAGILPAAMLPGDRFRGDESATLGDAAALVVRSREFVTGALYKTPGSPRPRQAADYAAALAELGCLSGGPGRGPGLGEDLDPGRGLNLDADPNPDLDRPVSREELVALFACALKEAGVRTLLTSGARAGASGRYVIPGTEAYRPEQRYFSVGTFGFWSRGEDIRAKGWLGDELQRGLLTFTWRPVGAGFGLYWPRFDRDGGDLVLGRLDLGGVLVSAAYSVPGPAAARWDMAADVAGAEVRSSVFLSRAFPAVLAVTESDRVAWRVDTRTFALDRISYAGAGGELVTVELGEEAPRSVPGERLGAPWILLHQTLAGTGESVPILIRLEQRPERIAADRGSGVELRFRKSAGSVSVMPLYGIRRRATGAPESEAKPLAEFWSRALAAFPVDLEEQYEVDEDAGAVWVTASFAYRETADAWGTEPLRIAPIPPVIALAEAGGYPVAWGGELERSETATFLGPFAFQRGAAARYRLPLYAALDQVYAPLKVTGDSELEALQNGVLGHVSARWFEWPSPAVDSTLLAAHARAYALVEEEEARVWYKDRIAQSLSEYYDERNLATVVQPANGQSYVYNERIWAAGEDFDREYYIGRQLVITGEVAQWAGWDIVRPYWDAVRGLYAYYRIHWDWAWQGATTFQTGVSFQADGAVLAWEGIMHAARMARLAGDDELHSDALYRAAALGASLFALWDLTAWAIANDYAVMHPGTASEPPRRRPPGEILTGFLPDALSEYTGVVTTMPTEWGASNWLHDELMGRTRFFNDYRFAELYDWQMRAVPRLYPVLRDNYNARAHFGTRAVLYGRDPSLEAAIAALREDAAGGPASIHSILLRSLVPQVWVSASTARVKRNEWDAGRRRLVTEIEAVADGRVTYEWAWRSVERIDSLSPAPEPGPLPALVLVNGEPVIHGLAAGGWRRISIPVKAGELIRVEISFSGDTHHIP